MPTPTPKVKFTIQEITARLHQLTMIETIISNGYVYRIDFDEHSSTVDYARTCYDSAKLQFEEGIITSEEYKEEYDMYMETLDKYLIVDEDNKICGEYFSKTKHFIMFCWRFITEGKVYYHDDQREVFTYTGRHLGQLTDNMQIVRDLTSDSDNDNEDNDNEDNVNENNDNDNEDDDDDSDSDSDYEDEDEDEDEN